MRMKSLNHLKNRHTSLFFYAISQVGQARVQLNGANVS